MRSASDMQDRRHGVDAWPRRGYPPRKPKSCLLLGGCCVTYLEDIRGICPILEALSHVLASSLKPSPICAPNVIDACCTTACNADNRAAAHLPHRTAVPTQNKPSSAGPHRGRLRYCALAPYLACPLEGSSLCLAPRRQAEHDGGLLGPSKMGHRSRRGKVLGEKGFSGRRTEKADVVSVKR